MPPFIGLTWLQEPNSLLPKHCRNGASLHGKQVFCRTYLDVKAKCLSSLRCLCRASVADS
ncbi:hypothetical protein LIA77_02054 [Sarocladium implicatum]|nr:hypothetical protein LIA77_02054 [Sarocladium implicatum]